MRLPNSTVIRALPFIGACAVALTCDSATRLPVPTAITTHAGNNQTATVAAAVGVRPSVIVTNDKGGPAGGVTVTFAVALGAGTVTGATQTTGTDGIAAVGGWTLGTIAGANTLSAAALGLTGSPVTFTATGTAGAPSGIAKEGGDGQSATVGTAVAIKPAARVTDAYGNAVSGTGVTFAVASGGGALTAATQTTNASGVATVGSWTLGYTAGTNQLTATLTGLSPLTFTATATVPPAVTQVSIRPTSFGILVGDTVTLIAIGKDVSGNPVPCTSTTWGSPSSSAVSVSSAGFVTGLAQGFTEVPATIDGVRSSATMSVYSSQTLDSVRFVLTTGGNTIGWAETTQPVGQTRCVALYTFDLNNITDALRWGACRFR